MASRASSGTEGEIVHSVSDVGTKRPYEKMAQELQGLAKLNASMGGSGEAAALAADAMLSATSVDDILAAGDAGGRSTEDMVGVRFDLVEIEWAPSAEQYKAPFGVMGWFKYVDHSTGEEGVFSSGAGNIVAAGRAMEAGNHLPVKNLTIKGRATGGGTLYTFAR